MILQFPHRLHFLSVSSTNDEAKKLLSDENFTMATADFQYSGRGRSGKEWVGNAAENVFCSFGIRHYQPNSDLIPIALQAAGSLLALEMLQHFAPDIRFGLKYPNDVYAINAEKQFKIAGILVENEYMGTALHSSIIGIGVNLLQAYFTDELNAVSLLQLGIHSTPQKAYNFLYEHAGKFFSEAIRFPAITVSRWAEVLDIEGKIITIVQSNKHGIAIGLSDEGHLHIRNPNTDEIMVCTNGDSIRYDIFR